ncbi:MAG: hypothetical protein H6Q71_2040 [Firmicutes bacterium]|nr:hypothetical protein [Bacillota bacterium]
MGDSKNERICKVTARRTEPLSMAGLYLSGIEEKLKHGLINYDFAVVNLFSRF